MDDRRPIRHTKASAIASVVVALRRRLWAIVFLCVVAAPCLHAAPTGYALSGLEAFDVTMTALMKKWDIPGGSLAVAKDGRLLLAHGYGVANRETGELVQPTHLFRLASLAKTITAVAILQLVENGKLGLDDKVLPILGEIGPRPEVISDARVHDITIRQLLQHSAGFDQAGRYDPLVMPRVAEAIGRQGGPFPPTCQAVLRDTLELQLQFAPGSRYAYSNVGYCILGRVVERISATPFERYVRENILAPAGANLRLSRTLEKSEGEVTYYDYPGAPLILAVPGYGRTMAPRPYGMVPLEALDSVQGWSGTAVDYLRFVLAIDGQRGRPLLSKETFLTQLESRVPIKAGDAKTAFYGLGVYLRPTPNSTIWWHDGSQPGVFSFFLRRPEGYSWVIAFNSHPDKVNDFRDELDQVLWKAKGQVKSWPNGDLFPKFP